MSGDHNMHQKPKALELADYCLNLAAEIEIDQTHFTDDLYEVAEELHRLQTDSEAKDALLRKAMEALERGESALRFAAITAIKEHLK